MQEYFKPYNGKDKYIFVSYSHRDSKKVLEYIAPLSKEGYRIWYDEGIPAGSDWPQSVRDRLYACDTVLFNASADSYNSENCFSEISRAKETGKRILVRKLDDAPLEGKWSEVLKNVQTVGENEIRDFLDDSFIGPYGDDEDLPIITGSKFMLIASVLAILFLAASLYFAFGAVRGDYNEILGIEESQVQSTPIVNSKEVDDVNLKNLFEKDIEFPKSHPEVEEAVRYELGIITDTGKMSLKNEEIPSIKELYICGSLATDTSDNIRYNEQKGRYELHSLSTTGTLTNLDDFSQYLYLEKLWVVSSDIKSISGVSELVRLEELNVSGNPISSVSDINGFESLTELDISHTDITDLTPLGKLRSLQKVTVSMDMAGKLILDKNARYEVVLSK